MPFQQIPSQYHPYFQTVNQPMGKLITYTKIGFDQLVEHIAKDSGMSEGACDGAVRSIVKQVEEMVLNGHTIFIKDLGSFKMSISAKAPLDEEEAGAKQVYRRRLLFHPSEKLKDEVESTELVSV